MPRKEYLWIKMDRVCIPWFKLKSFKYCFVFTDLITHSYTNCSNFVRLKSSLLPSKLTVPDLSPSLMGGKPTARYWYQITVFSVC